MEVEHLNHSTSHNVSGVNTIADDVKFKNEPLVEVVKEAKRKRKNEDDESTKQEEELYNRQVHEKRYKLLMHLLNKSKFYSDFIIKKIEKPVEPDKKLKGKVKVKAQDENTPPENNRVKTVKAGQKYDIREYISPDMGKELNKMSKKLSDDEIEDELSTHDPDEDESERKTSTDKFASPKYFAGELHDYQKEGFRWLNILYQNGLNGILADEMGLGKTVQIISLICHLMEKRQAGPYLIVAPLSTLPNWMLEFERFAPDIPVVLLHGPMAARVAAHKKIVQKYTVDKSFRTQPVVVTSFDTVQQDTHFLRSQAWRYIIVDEAQRIKNHKCLLIKGLKSMKSMNRLLLSGTPLQNNLAELWSLLNFLLPEIFDNLAVFESWFNLIEMEDAEGTEKLLKQEQEKHVIHSLREIVKPFMLRRTKADVNLNIPPKKEIVVYAPLTELQHDLYKAILNRDISRLTRISEESVILDVNGKKPKRKCIQRHPYGHQPNQNDQEKEMSPALSSHDSNDSSEFNSWKNIKPGEHENIQTWKQYTDVTERNAEYFIRMSYGNRTVLYKKVVNHPYLIHCPLGAGGLPRIDEDLVKVSGKLLVLDVMLAKLKSRGHKVLLFSTMTMILDMIEDYLSLRSYTYVRLDGVTPIEDRKENIQRFNKDPDTFLFLISTKAGGVGLNLVGADTVIIYDSDWNPQVDLQAMARCHRIGQTKPVVIYRLCTKGTIDEKIIKRANNKRVLEKMVISKEANSININNKDVLLELKTLLESKDYDVATAENAVFTEEEINQLLDRSDLISNKEE